MTITFTAPIAQNAMAQALASLIKAKIAAQANTAMKIAIAAKPMPAARAKTTAMAAS